MKFTSTEAIEQVIFMLEQALEEHSKWIKLWNSRAICNLPFPADYLDNNAYLECEFAKWFLASKSEGWMHQLDYENIFSIHRTMHEEARLLAEKVKRGEEVVEEDYYRFVNYEWSFSQRLQKLKDKITRLQISFDSLTGIFNRQAMMPILMQEQAYIDRDKKECSLAMADLDFFKKVNDSYGHANGDLVLKKVATFLRSNLRPYDALFRYGGEEFLFCLPNTNVITAQQLLNRLRADLEKMPIKLTTDEIISVTISIGIASMSSQCTTEESVHKADVALYEAKSKGRNCISVFKQGYSKSQAR